MIKKKTLTYKDTGVAYDVMDPLKKLAQAAGARTSHNLTSDKFREATLSRGESAFVIEAKNQYFASVIEGLGTKNMVADAMRAITAKTYYDSIAQDTVAMIVNDLITVGATPINILAYWAAGSSKWFNDQERMKDLVHGWEKACNLAGVIWGGGETPTLTGVIQESTIDLGGSCFGIINPKKNLILGEKLHVGDAIILLESSGIHANGLTLARKVAEKLPQGYATRIKDGLMYGEALLVPTIIYSKLIQDLFSNKIDIHYMANITGHGWRKIMRNSKPFTYRISSIPPIPAVLKFIMEQGPVEVKEAYGNFNMGAGFALFVPHRDAADVIKIAKKHRIKAYLAGKIEKGVKRIIIEPNNIIFEGESLQVKA
jgi:phosphoribosylformylglycinamidine cyclo-ligase